MRAIFDRYGVSRPADRLAVLPPSSPTTVAVIEGIATAAPDRVVEQGVVADLVAGALTDSLQRERISRVYGKTRIATRRMAVDPFDPAFAEFRRRPGTIRDRMGLFYQHAVPLAVDAAARALAAAGCDAADVGLLIFVTSTGLVAPGVDVAVVKELGLSRSVGRLVVNFMGCAAAMNGIRTAATFVRSYPDRKAMVICLELSSVNAVFAEDVNDVITHSLFGDGCAVVVVGASEVQQRLAPGKVVVRGCFSRLLDGAEDGIVLGVNDDGITCELSENLPDYIFAGVDPAVTEVLREHGLHKSDVDLWAIHPGGPRIIEQSVRSLGIPDERAELSWEVLARFGNMLSVSLLFVLELMVRAAAVKDIATGVALAFAPGVAVEGMLFDIIHR